MYFVRLDLYLRNSNKKKLAVDMSPTSSLGDYKMKKIELYALGFLILFFLTACGSIGKNFDSSQLKSIKNNVTSKEEIFRKFGEPFKKGIEGGQAMWTYQFDKWNILGPAESKDLVILFDEKNIVRAYRYTASESE